MSCFININNKWINLKNVSTIIFDEKENLIYFNFSNSIKIINKETSDFYEAKFNNKNDYENTKENILRNKYVKNHFLMHKSQNEIVNKEKINTITIDKNKIIFNLSHSIEIEDRITKKRKKISKFVYWKFGDEDEAKNVFASISFKFIKTCKGE